MTDHSTVPGAFLGIVYDTYDDTRWRPLVGAVQQVGDLAEVLGGYGFRSVIVPNPGQDDVRTALRSWARDWSDGGKHGPAVVAWSGHGEVDGSGLLKLIARDTADLTDLEGYSTSEQVANQAVKSGADQILLLLDTCHSGAGLMAALNQAFKTWSLRPAPEPRARWLGVLAACQPHEKAAGARGVLLETVLRLLREGPRRRSDAPGGDADVDGQYRHEWSVRNEGITGHTLAQAVIAEWPTSGQRPALVSTERPLPMFHNPLFSPPGSEDLVEHLILAARGIARTEEGWLFTGRQRALEKITAWMAERPAGMLLLTGSAGVGKSAVAGRIAALSNTVQRADLMAHAPLAEGEPDPGEGVVDVALHLRGMNVQDLAESLAYPLGLPVPKTPAALISELEKQERAEHRRRLLVLDGLDEAAPGQAGLISEQLLVPLSRLCTVLLASRDRPFQPHQQQSGETLDAALSRIMQSSVLTVDLDQEPDTVGDIAEYVEKRLIADGLPDATASEIAPVLADRAARGSGGFLFARIVASSLAHALSANPERPWHDLIPSTIAEALRNDLAAGDVRHRDGVALPDAAQDLLTALAWAAGYGMPALGVWETAAQAVSEEGTVYGPDDIDWLLKHYGRYIVEDSDGPQAVYRLYHRELVTHLRGVSGPAAVDGTPAALAIVGAFVALLLEQAGEGGQPELVNPYVRQRIAAHALSAGGPGVAALRQLVAADPGSYLPDLASALHDLAAYLSEVGRRDEALAPAQEAATTYRNLANTNPDHVPDLAGSLNNLATCLAAVGRREEVLAPAQEAATIYRELARGSSNAHLPNLAMALNNLAAALSEVGRSEEALAPAQEAAITYRNLARANPNAHLPNLAATLNNLAAHLSAVGRREEALAPAQEAAITYRNLANTNPDAHLPNLAGTLSNLATRLAAVGRRDEALAPAQEAAITYRNLARANPDAHLPDLAGSLSTLATCLAAVGRRDEGLAPVQEAVRIRRDLAHANPDAHLPDLAMALNNLAARLAGVGRREEALAPVQEAVRIRRDLARANPDAYLPNLAMALNNLAAALSEGGRRNEALAPAQEAATTYRDLARANPDAYLPDLAMALNNLANHLSEAGRRDDALAPVQEAVRIRRDLARANPDAYLPDLAGSLNNLAAHLSAVGRHDEALAPAQEAATTYRNLAQANPDAYLPNLAGSLNNLATCLAEVGLTAQALRLFDDVIDDWRGQPRIAANIAHRRAEFLVHRIGIGEGVVALCALLRPTQELGARVAFQVRQRLRSIAADAPGQREVITDLCAESKASSWLDITPESLQLAADWINTDTWSDSYRFLLDHPELLYDDSHLALQELTLLSPSAARHDQFLDQMRAGAPAMAVYRPMLLQETLVEWIKEGAREEGWTRSTAFLTAHAQDLLAPDADAALAAMADGQQGPNPVIATHRAILALATSDGIEPAYQALANHQALHARIQRALEIADGPTLEWLAVLEEFVLSSFWTAAAHWLAARALAPAEAAPASIEPDDTPAPRPTPLAAHIAATAAPADVLAAAAEARTPTPGDRDRVLAELAALIGARPSRAAALSTVLQAVLATDTQAAKG
ncbi:tetratricopeptide repeat protein [Kitasatospora sp. NPDC047058]|uniref:tetratricopeptide repeat protein n=1 Tax=Kitasatospora sp. NPDC047058 TaxID=3155620 RepID=UPI0034094E67